VPGAGHDDHPRRLGFASRSHFSRAFSRAYGADPSSYRKRHDRNAIELPANAGRSWLDKISYA
jgi:AraC-like DNA-binding protein